jgi:uncharacterized membrane protein HdeD (DUF308 family)
MESTQNPRKLIRSWWVYLLNGILFIVLGIWMLTMPSESLRTFSIIIGLIVGLSGLTEVILSIYYRKKHEEWVWNASGGALDLIIGALILFDPRVFLILITVAISLSLIVAAIILIRSAILSKRERHSSWSWKLGFGVVILLLAIVLMLQPEVLAITMMFWMGISFISLGILRILLAFQMHSILKR